MRKDYGPENFKAMGEEFIRKYYERYKPFDQSMIIGLEKRIEICIGNEGKYKIIGFVDRLTQNGDGVYEIHDYKTNKALKTQAEVEEDKQLSLYAIAIREMFPDAKVVRQIWHFLAHDKEMVVEKSVEDLEKLKEERVELIKRIESEKDFVQSPSALCGWCDYRAHCPDFKHIVSTEELPPNKFLNEPGVKLVNRYVELMEKKASAEDKIKNEIGNELEQIKEAMIALSEKEGIRAINGSEQIARIWAKDCYKFPGRKDPGRGNLEKIVRQAGLWNDASSLDTFALSRLLDNPPPEWPSPIVESIKSMAMKERVERIYLSKRKEY